MLSISKYSFRYFLNAALYLVYVLLTHISGKVLFFLLSEKLFFVSMFQIRDCPIIFVRMTVKSFFCCCNKSFCHILAQFMLCILFLKSYKIIQCHKSFSTYHQPIKYWLQKFVLIERHS